ncbi:hypothetical protein GF362_05460 [Candidatus Dojkabacteria bacterium]|nr:hypothetical protein [Candidatus Dojkabacteria bacterium]
MEECIGQTQGGFCQNCPEFILNCPPLLEENPGVTEEAIKANKLARANAACTGLPQFMRPDPETLLTVTR